MFVSFGMEAHPSRQLPTSGLGQTVEAPRRLLVERHRHQPSPRSPTSAHARPRTPFLPGKSQRFRGGGCGPASCPFGIGRLEELADLRHVALPERIDVLDEQAALLRAATVEAMYDGRVRRCGARSRTGKDWELPRLSCCQGADARRPSGSLAHVAVHRSGEPNGPRASTFRRVTQVADHRTASPVTDPVGAASCP